MAIIFIIINYNVLHKSTLNTQDIAQLCTELQFSAQITQIYTQDIAQLCTNEAHNGDGFQVLLGFIFCQFLSIELKDIENRSF